MWLVASGGQGFVLPSQLVHLLEGASSSSGVHVPVCAALTKNHHWRSGSASSVPNTSDLLELLHNKSPLLCKSFYHEAALKETLCLHQQQLNMTPETADTPNDCYTVPEYIHTYMQTLKIAPDWQFLPLISRFHSDTKPVWMYRHTKKRTCYPVSSLRDLSLLKRTHHIAFNISYPSKWGYGSRPRETAGEDMEQDILENKMSLF